MEKRKHKLVDRFPMAMPVLMGFLMLIVVQALADIGERSIAFLGSPLKEFLAILFILLAGILVLAWYKHWFRPEFKGVLTGGDFKKGIPYLYLG